MKRSEFLKKLGLGIGVAVVAPKVIIPKGNTEVTDHGYSKPGWFIPKANKPDVTLRFKNPYTYAECYRLSSDGIRIGGMYIDSKGNMRIEGSYMRGNIYPL